MDVIAGICGFIQAAIKGLLAMIWEFLHMLGM